MLNICQISRLLACIVASMFMCSISDARAATVTIGTTGAASEVDGIVANGVTYNVTFQDLSFNTGDMTFVGDATDAALAGQALIAALNAASTSRVQLDNDTPPISVNYFIVQDVGYQQGIEYSTTLPGKGRDHGSRSETSWDPSIALRLSRRSPQSPAPSLAQACPV